MHIAPMPADRSEARGIRSVAIVGAGMMGTAIAAANVRCSVPVVLTDSDERVLTGAPTRIAQDLATESGARCQPAVDVGNVPDGEGQLSSPEIAEKVGRLVAVTTDPVRLGACDLVLESIVEALAAKQQLYSWLEPHLASGSLLASNTSTIPIARLARNLQAPGRFLGLHFFHPVGGRPLIEIIRGPQTEPHAIAAAVAYAKAIEKVPIVVNDGPGFLVNRLLVPYLAEALEFLLEGVAIREIERAATEFGMAMGPLRLMDEIGLDTALRGGRVLWEAFPDRVMPSPLLVAMYKAGRLGRKTGAGFFAYPSSEDPGPEPELAPGVVDLIADWARPRGITAGDQIIVRLLLPMVLEATRVLEERMVDGPDSIDLAVNLGLGFPAARGGLLRWADSLSARRIIAMLTDLADRGPRFQPTPRLSEMARQHQGFYPRAA